MSGEELDHVSCECGLGPNLNECCGPFIEGAQNPETAEQLMRSRYTAYATENIDYIIASHDPDTVKDVDRESSEQWAKEASWDGLEVLSSEAGAATDDTGMVEFVAKYTIGANSYAHHERATFRKVEGAWKFVDGEMVKPKPVVRETPKVGRNEPCPCGSGKKFKKCCGKN